MHNLKLLAALLLSTALIASASFADDDDDEHSGCTQSLVTKVDSNHLVNQEIDGNYGTGFGADANGKLSSELTTCIEKRSNIEVVVAWNNGLVNKKILNDKGNTIGQQSVNVRNLARDYETNYGMEYGEDFDVVVVAYADGVDWLKKTTEQANQAFIKNEILGRGIKIYACQNTMKSKKLVISDLIDGVEMVPAGVTAVVDFQKQGRTYLLP